MPADHSTPDEQPQDATGIQGTYSSDDSVSEVDLLERDFEKMVNTFRKSSKDILRVKSEVIPEFRKKVIQKLKPHCTWFPAKLVKTAGSSVKRFEKYRPLLEALLEECPDFPAWKDEEYEATTMHIAMRNAGEGFIRFLCERSPAAVKALSMMTKYQKNCLYIAIEESRDTGLIQYLITCVDRGTVDSVGLEMNTPLHLAVHYDRCRNGQLQIVEGLLQVSINSLQKENEFKSSHNHRTLTGNGLDTLRLAPLQYHIYSRQNSKASAEKDKVADDIAALLRMHCLRLNLGREKTLSLLYGELEPKAITFDLWGYETVREEDLDMLSYLDFETVLQAVVLPELKVIPLPPGQVMQSELSNQLESSEEKKPLRLPECPGRTDYCRIFRWLRMRKVDKILRVSVQDRVLGSHSDESIEWCLGNMGVEIWDWNKLDICFTTIKAAAPLVRKLTLYSSGNNAVLRSWADENGLCTLPDLREVHVEVLQGLESRERTQESVRVFQETLKSQRQRICSMADNCDNEQNATPCSKHFISVTVNYIWQDGSTSTPRLKNGLKKGKGEKQDWLRCMEEFAKFIRNFTPSPSRTNTLLNGASHAGIRYTKVAIIDDGVDGLYAGLGRNIAGGESFCNRGDSDYDSFFKSSGGHGTIMAVLIRKMCPHVKLYVARVNEERTGNDTREITAESAIKAIKWATERKVDIISMSWTINETGPTATELNQLTEAINKAVENKILLFCSVSDQGPRNEGRFPAACNRSNTFLIGAATVEGQGWQWLGKNDVDYIFPGTDLIIGTGDPLFDDGSANSSRRTSREPYSGSSLATALAAGLAALVLNCVALSSPNDLKLVKTHRGMQLAFGSINTGGGQEKYLAVWDLFEKKLKDLGDKDEPEVLGEIVQRLLSHVRGSVPTALTE